MAIEPQDLLVFYEDGIIGMLKNLPLKSTIA